MKNNRIRWSQYASLALVSSSVFVDAAPVYVIGKNSPEHYESLNPKTSKKDTTSLKSADSELNPIQALVQLNAVTALSHGAIAVAQTGTPQDSIPQKRVVAKAQTLTPTPFQAMDGAEYQIPDSGHATVVIFMSITCPIARLYSEEVNKIYEDYKKKLGDKLRLYVVYVYIESENPSKDFSLEKAKKFTTATFTNQFPTFFDADGSIAKKFKATYSPEAVVIDSKGIVRYQGRIDDRLGTKPASNRYVRRALNNISEGDKNTVIMEYVRPLGCTIIPIPDGSSTKK